METATDGTAAGESFADILPLHPTATQFDDQGVLIWRPFGLLLCWRFGRVRGLQALGSTRWTGLGQGWHDHGSRAGHSHHGSQTQWWPYRPGRVPGVQAGGGFFLILGLE